MPCAVEDFVSPVNVVATTAAFFGGEIDLDPASSENANKLVGANRFFIPEDQGLKQLWKAKTSTCIHLGTSCSPVNNPRTTDCMYVSVDLLNPLNVFGWRRCCGSTGTLNSMKEFYF
jgi:hypothetical protein